MSNALGDYLNSINDNKKNLMRDSGAMEAAEKSYPSFPVARSLSYHPDAILMVDELNQRGLSEHKMRPVMHYEFLLNLIPRRKRYGKWAKPENDDKVQLIKKCFNYSEEKALAVMHLFTEEQFDIMRRSREQGGLHSNVGKKRSSR